MRIDSAAPVENTGQRLARPLAKFVQHGGLMNARYRAERRTALGTRRFASQIFRRVVNERNAGPAALLRAVMHQPVFADIQKAAAGAAVPVIRQPSPDVFLKMIEMRKREQSGFEAPETFVGASLTRRERLQ